MTRNKKWNAFFCVVKNGSLECYKGLEVAAPDVMFSVKDVKIEQSGLPKHELALKLTQDNDQTVLFLEVGCFENKYIIR